MARPTSATQLSVAPRRRGDAGRGQRRAASSSLEYFGDGRPAARCCSTSSSTSGRSSPWPATRSAPIIQALPRRRRCPTACQWATFLRNHDEVDLGRLVGHEHDEVFAAFGPDPDMQLYDRGIRRRLAPMLGNDRRRHRDGVRAAVQPARHAGAPLRRRDRHGRGPVAARAQRHPYADAVVSRAATAASPRAAQARPAAAGHRRAASSATSTVNVDAQQRDPASLLAWFERMLLHPARVPGVRRRHLHATSTPASGRSSRSSTTRRPARCSPSTTSADEAAPSTSARRPASRRRPDRGVRRPRLPAVGADLDGIDVGRLRLPLDPPPPHASAPAPAPRAPDDRRLVRVRGPHGGSPGLLSSPRSLGAVHRRRHGARWWFRRDSVGARPHRAAALFLVASARPWDPPSACHHLAVAERSVGLGAVRGDLDSRRADLTVQRTGRPDPARRRLLSLRRASSIATATTATSCSRRSPLGPPAHHSVSWPTRRCRRRCRTPTSSTARTARRSVARDAWDRRAVGRRRRLDQHGERHPRRRVAPSTASSPRPSARPTSPPRSWSSPTPTGTASPGSRRHVHRFMDVLGDHLGVELPSLEQTHGDPIAR